LRGRAAAAMTAAMAQQSMAQPFATKKRPPSTGMDSVVRFSDVAQFVGLSLLRDPALARPKVRRKANSSAGAKEEVKKAVDKEMRPISAEARMSLAANVHAAALGGGSLEVALPEVTAERSDQLRTQLQWLRAERRAEQEELRKLEHSLSDAMLAEKKAHDRAEKHREMKEFHRKRNAQVEQKMLMLREELRAGERAQRQLEKLEMERQGTPGLYGDTGESMISPPTSPTSPVALASMSASMSSPAVSSQALRSRDLAATGDSLASASQSDSRVTPSDSRQTTMKHSASAPVMASTSEADGNRVRGSSTSPSAAPAAASGNLVRGSASAPSPTTAVEERPGSRSSSKGQRPGHSAGSSTSSPGGKPKVTALANMPTPVEEEDFRDRPDEDKREAVRRKAVTLTGCTCKQVFRKLDVNASGCISLGDFAAGLSRLGVNWQQITGLRRERDIFRLFDDHRRGYIDLFDLFPSERNPPPGEPPSTPDFWKKWCWENRDISKDSEREKGRKSKWQPVDAEEELALVMGSVDFQKEVDFKKKWMRSTIRRLKSRGKSDARCREIVALHLPRGTGPKDREDVHTFSKLEVKQCIREYNDKVNDPARVIQKELYELREQRRLLQTSRQKLYSVAMEPVIRHQQEQERKNLLTGMGGFSLLGKPKDPNKAPAADAAAAAAAEAAAQVDESSSFAELQRRCENMDIDQIEDVFKVWMKYADKKDEVISKHGFVKMLEELTMNKRTMVPNDIHAFWDQLTKLPGAPHEGEMLPGAEKANAAAAAAAGGGDAARRGSVGLGAGFSLDKVSKASANVQQEAANKRASMRQTPARKPKIASFDQFIVWYSSSEMRVS